MPERRVNADPERFDRRAAASTNQTQRIDKGMAIAAVVQALPWFVWAAPFQLLAGFICLTWWYERNHLEDFTGGVLLWVSRVLIALGVVLLIAGLWKCYKLYHDFMLDIAVRRTARAGATKAVAAARGQELKNDLTQADIALRQKMPQVILALTQAGVAFKYDAKGTLEVLGPAAGRTLVTQMGGTQEQVGAGAQAALAGPADGLPEKVLYEEVRDKVPLGHVLVGIGLRGLIDTVEWAVGACIWIVGLSGTGKTSTTVLRVEERHQADHKFLGVDPHFFKHDSLTNAVKAYAGAFIRPMARTAEETNQVLTLFLSTFLGRKSGQVKPGPDGKWPALTLMVDEVGSLMDTTDPLEKENADLLKRIARICGQEARDFQMGGIFISQQATGLAWLRKVALMVIVHQLLMTSEKELACNGDKAVMKDMERWPRGRTYVFGVGFGANGARTVQQPYFGGPSGPVVAASGDELAGDDLALEDESDVVESQASGPEQEEEEDVLPPPPPPALTGDMRKVYDACSQLVNQGERVSSRAVEALTGIDKDKANGLMNKLAQMGYIQRGKAV